MTRKVKAYGKVFAFPADMSNDAIAKVLLSKRKELDPELQKNPEVLDYLKGFAVGANELLGGAGWVAEKVGADNVGKKLGEMRDVGVKYWKDSMTPAGQQAMEDNVVEDDLSLGKNWGRALGMNITKSLPAMIATAPVGGVLSKGIQTGAKALGAGGATSALLAGTAAPVGVTSNIIARVPTAIGFGAAEGLGAGVQNAAAFKKQIIGMPEKELEKSPRYQSLKAEHGAMKARKLLADEASTELFQNTALSTGAIGALTGGGALGQAYQKITTGTSSGLVKETAKGIFGEAIQEAPQSGAEQYLSNLATKDYLDPTQDLSKGVVSAAATGALVGGVTGGLFGAGGAINVTSKDYQQKAHEVAGAINEEIIAKDVANIASAPTVEDAIAATTQAVSRKPITKDTVLSTVDPTLTDLEALQNETQKTTDITGQPQAAEVLDIVLPDNSSVKAQWKIVDADSIKASMKEDVNQPRDRTRAASDIQIKSIANAPDYRRLSDSPVMDVGAPVVDQNGRIVAGNGRFAGLSQAYDQGTATEYLNQLRADAARKGLSIEGIAKPVLVRQLSDPVDTRKMAIASNSGTTLQMSALEQANLDAERMKGIENLDVNDLGDIALTPRNLTQLKDSLGSYTSTELGSLVDKGGQLSQEGMRRVRNAMLAKAYGSSPTLEKLVESTDSDMRNVLGALTKSASHIIGTKGDTKALLEAVDTYSQLKATGQPVDNFLAQQDAFSDGLSKEAEGILRFIDTNIRSQKKLTDFFKGNFVEVDTTSADMFAPKLSVAPKDKINLSEGSDIRETRIGDSTLVYGYSDGKLKLYSVRTPQAKRGAGSARRAMETFVAQADKENKTIFLDASALDKKTSTDKLVTFYKSLGFELTGKKANPLGEPEMKRSPNTRDSNVKQLEKHLKDNGYDFRVEPASVRDLDALDSTKKARKELAEKQAKLFKKKVVFVKADGTFRINGVMVPSIADTIFVDIRTDKAFDAIMAHELSHWMEQEKPAVYKEMLKSLKTVIINEAEYAKKYGIEGATKAEITKEIVGDLIGDNFTEQSFWQKVAEANPKAFKDIAAAIIKWLKGVIVKAKANGMGSEQWVKDATKAQDIIAKAVAQYTESEAASVGTESKPKFHKAFHGSPHDHNKFDSSKIGTGEGEQAYGYGHYFAESKDVAEWYKDKLSSNPEHNWYDRSLLWNGNEISVSQLQVHGININEMSDVLKEFFGGTKENFEEERSSAIEKLNRDKKWLIDNNKSQDRINNTNKSIEFLNQIKFGDDVKNTGKLYEVELAPEQDEYLLWDKPLSEQSDKVKNIIESTDEYKRSKRNDKKYVSQGYESIVNRNGEYFYKYVFGDVGDGYKETSEYLRSLGIRGIKYLDGSSRGKGEGNYNYVIFDDNDIKIEAKFSKVAAENTLIAQHNLSVKNLLHADRMGGLAAPSIAVTDKAHPLKGFGEITLLSDKDLVDPKQGAKTYGSDIYSPRYPQLSYDFSGKAIKKLNEILSDGIEKTGDREFYNGSLENDPFRELTPSSAAMYQFLKEQGADPKLAFTKPKELPNESFRSFADSNMNSFDLSKDEKFKEAVKEHFAQISEREQIDEDAVNNLARAYARDVISYRDAKKNIGKIDRQATNSSLFRQITDSDLRNKFDDFLVDIVNRAAPKERIFQGYTNSGNRRYIPHDIDNVIKLLKKDLRGGENFKYGLGSIRAKYSPQFKSIDQIRKSKNRLMDSKTFALVKKEIQTELDSLNESLASYGTFSGFDNVENMLSDAAKMGISRALKDNGFENVPDSIKIDIQNFINKLKDMPTEYFEAKLLRAVKLGEFTAAIIPDDSTQQVKDILKKNGIEDIREYKAGDNEDRVKQINQVDRVMFSRVAKEMPKTININGRSLSQFADAIARRYKANKIGQSKGSRYYSLPDGRELRVSDHEFPRKHGGGVAQIDIVYNKEDDGVDIFHNEVKTGIVTKELSYRSLNLRGGNIGGLEGFNYDREAWETAVTRAIDDAISYSSDIVKTINIDGVDRPTTNSEGKAIHPTQEGISNFWKWFGDSKVVDEQGRPLVVYHGRDGKLYRPAEAEQVARKLREEAASIEQELRDRYGRDSNNSYRTDLWKDDNLYKNMENLYNKAKEAEGELWFKDSGLDGGLFDPKRSRDVGIHFTLDSGVASKFAKDSGSIFPVYLRAGELERTVDIFSRYQGLQEGLSNLKSIGLLTEAQASKLHNEAVTLDNKNYGDERDWGASNGVVNFWKKVNSILMKKDNFAIVYHNEVESGGDSYVVFNSNQVKSAIGNNGEYSSANNDIRFSKEAIPEETTYQKSQRTVQDKFNRFSVIRDWLKERGVKLTELSNVYDAEERYHAKVANQLEDFREKVRNPLVEKIAKAGFTLSDVQDFLLAQHASEANKQIQKVRNDSEALAYGITDEEASEYLSKAKPELATLANELRDVTEQAKQLRLDAGILNKDITDNWDNTYKHYVPVKGDESIQGTGKGLNVKHKDKRRLGHEKRNEAVIENILMDYERAVMEVEKNRVGKYLVMFAAEANNPDLITVGQPEKRNILKENNSYAIVDSDGVIHSVYVNKVDAQRNAPPGSSIQKISDPRVIAQASPMLAPNEVNVYMDGHAIRVQLNDDLLARAYANMGVESVGAIVEAGRVLNSYLSKVYTGYNPEFIVTNIIRDFTSGIVNLTGEEGTLMAVKAIGNYPKMFADLFRYAITRKSTALIDSYRANGGNTGAAYLSDMERLGKEISSEYASYQGVIANIKAGDGANAFIAAGRKVFNSTLKWIEYLNQAGENAMRLSAYKAMLDSGKTVEQASKVAKNITVNFNRRGEIGQTANALYLFFNASVQGSAAVLHANLRGNHKYQANALAVGMASLGYMLAAGLGGMDEEEYDKIDDTTKERNLIIGSGDSYVKIPIPYGYGFFFNTGRVIADAQRKGEFGKAPFRMAVNAVEELTPFGNLVNSDEINSEQVVGGVAPTALQIPYQMSTNTSLFTGKEIRPVSPFDSSQPEREQMFRNTKGTVYDDMAGLLSNAGFDVSPENIKFLTRTLTGGAGALVDTAVSSSKLKAQGAELDIKEMPFIRKFMGENTISNDRSAYYKAVEEATKAAEEFSRARKNNDISSMKKIMEDKRELLAMDKYANKLRKVIKLSRDMQDSVRLNEEIPIAEKRLKLKELEAQESKLYERYLDVYKARVK